VKMKSKKVETTPGRIIFNKILPPQMEFVNDKMDKKTDRKACRDNFRALRLKRGGGGP